MALASWLRGVRIPKGDTKPGKVQHFGANFDGTIFLETTTLRPYAKLRGRLCIETRFMLKFTGIHVQLEADLYLKFSSQSGRTVYRKKTCILENTIINKKSGDELSPVRHDVVPPVPEGKDLIVVILPGETKTELCENFLFTLAIPGDTLPKPFKSAYGSLTYKVVAYMRSIYGRYVQIAEKSLDFSGYHNLCLETEALKPMKLKKGLINLSANVQAILILESGAYLPEESVPFTMVVRNPGCIPLQITVFIAQKITYNVDGTPLSTCHRIDEVDLFESNPVADTCWKGSLTVPKGQACSYCVNQAYEVRYAVQFKVHVENQPMAIKGTLPLIIGTTREPVEALQATASSLQVPVNPWGERRGSTSSIRSEGSFRGYSHHKKPSLPSYSQVNSPVRSIESPVPPPPAYDEENDLELEEDTLTIPVPSTSTSIDEE